MHTLELRKEHQEKIFALNTTLEVAREHHVDLQPLKQYVLTEKTKMVQLQTAVEKERCKVLQIDNRLEEIMETASFFVDRSQDILEVLTV